MKLKTFLINSKYKALICAIIGALSISMYMFTGPKLRLLEYKVITPLYTKDYSCSIPEKQQNLIIEILKNPSVVMSIFEEGVHDRGEQIDFTGLLTYIPEVTKINSGYWNVSFNGPAELLQPKIIEKILNQAFDIYASTAVLGCEKVAFDDSLIRDKIFIDDLKSLVSADGTYTLTSRQARSLLALLSPTPKTIGEHELRPQYQMNQNFVYRRSATKIYILCMIYSVLGALLGVAAPLGYEIIRRRLEEIEIT